MQDFAVISVDRELRDELKVLAERYTVSKEIRVPISWVAERALKIGLKELKKELA